jgi:carboxyl-terminal processing protease
MKPSAKSICQIVAITAALIVSASAINPRSSEKLDAAETKAAITTLTARILESSQFAHHRLDDDFAGKFLDRYLDALDGGRLVFLQSDVEEFSRFRPDLARATRREGDTSPAKIIFQRYLERLEQRSVYIAELLKTEHFDFTTDERYGYDRKNAPRPRDLAAAQPLWRQQLRFEYLQEKLADKKDADIAQTLSRRSARLVQTMRKFNDQTVLELYLNALAHVYDPHSDYLGREQLASFNMGMNLSLVGIGATLQADDGYCKIRELVAGGPAARSGQLKNGDRIVGVAQGQSKDFTDLVDMPLAQAVDLIRGAKGTTVRLSIIPAGAGDAAVRKTVTIVRDEIKLEDQQARARVIDLPAEGGKTQRIGVIDLPGFYASEGKGARSATADVARLVRKLKRENATGLILDLRRNGGGSLEEAINLTGLFIPSGPVVQTRTMEGQVEIGADRDGTTLYDGPLVVLISRFSASASEIVAGALQDYGRAVIVGDTSTFGKGTVQTLVPLGRMLQQEGLTPSDDPGALKVTISKFYRPSGQSTQLAGVKSDIVLPSFTDSSEISEAELENPLPWDTIPAAEFDATNRVRPYLAALKAGSAGRIAKDVEFAELQRDRELFRKDRESKSVSLNEAERRREKAELEARLEAQKKGRQARAGAQPPTYEITLKNVGKPGLGEPMKNPNPFAQAALKAPTPATADDDDDDTTPADDLLLREAEHILADYAGLLARKTTPIVTQR